MLGELFRARAHIGPSRATNFAHRTQKHGDVETNDTTAHPQQGTTETGITSAREKCTKNAHFSPAKAMAVSIPHRHKRAKATMVSDNRATWPTGPGRGTGGTKGPGCGTRGRQGLAEAGGADTTVSQISHVIYRGHFSRCPKNVAIPTMQIQCLNESSRNYVRNWWLAAIAGYQGNASSNISREGPTGAEGAGGTAGPGRGTGEIGRLGCGVRGLRCPWRQGLAGQ